MTDKLTESAIETFAIELFEKLGYQYVYGPDIGGTAKGKKGFGDKSEAFSFAAVTESCS